MVSVLLCSWVLKLPIETYDSEPPPLLGSWRKSEHSSPRLARASYRALLRVHALFYWYTSRLDRHDLHHRRHPQLRAVARAWQQDRGSVPARRQVHALVRHGTVDHGHPGERLTFIATTGQAYVDGMRFVQFYFGLPVAMVILSATAVPIFHRSASTPPTIS